MPSREVIRRWARPLRIPVGRVVRDAHKQYWNDWEDRRLSNLEEPSTAFVLWHDLRCLLCKNKLPES